MTADEALEAGLVDEIGYLDDALAKAEALGRFAKANPPAVYLVPRRGWMQKLLGVEASDAMSLASVLPRDVDSMRNMALEAGIPRLMYLFRP